MVRKGERLESRRGREGLAHLGCTPSLLEEGRGQSTCWSARVTAVESTYAMYLGKHHHQAVESPTYVERERDSGKMRYERKMRGREREDEGLPHWIWIYCELVKGEVVESWICRIKDGNLGSPAPPPCCPSYCPAMDIGSRQVPPARSERWERKERDIGSNR
jgi:hypothetical protein